MRGFLVVLTAAAALLVATSAGAALEQAVAPSAGTAMPLLYKNCTNLSRKYRHGLGKRGARDRTKSGDPVTNFLRSTLIYNRAIRWNGGLDRDKDGVACEKH